MTALRIVAAASYQGVLGDSPTELRSSLQALGAQALRRINRYIELAVLGALQCRQAAGTIAPETALYLAAEAPMLADCVKALNGLVVQQRPPTPFEFMNISGNMAGFYIAQQLGITGPQLVLHRGGAGLQCALELLPLHSARHRRSLVGYVEEGIWPLSEQRERLQLPADRAIAECSHWFYFDAECAQPRALLAPTLRLTDTAGLEPHMTTAGDALRLGGSGLCPDECRRWGLQSDGAVDVPYSSGRCAAALARWVQEDEHTEFLYLDRGSDGAYSLIRATKS